jgi:hypothetical protein
VDLKCNDKYFYKRHRKGYSEREAREDQVKKYIENEVVELVE